jgi:hypothetical protein
MDIVYMKPDTFIATVKISVFLLNRFYIVEICASRNHSQQ